ncbi:MAG: FAD-dependent oxidoreductase, partial [Myxococcota bacterium]
MNQADFIIVGGGMAGLATAYHLRERGSVVLLEADRCGTPQGSSFGASRMYREMYSDKFLCERAKEANALWSAMETAHETELRRQHG